MHTRLAPTMPRCRLLHNAAPAARLAEYQRGSSLYVDPSLIEIHIALPQKRRCFCACCLSHACGVKPLRRKARIVQVSAEVDEEAKRLKPGAKPGAPPGAAASGGERPHGTHADAV
jgi:hypothetical protein